MGLFGNLLLPPKTHRPSAAPFAAPSSSRVRPIFADILENFCHHRGSGEPARRAGPGRVRGIDQGRWGRVHDIDPGRCKPMGEMCDFGCGESTKWVFLEFTTELSNFRKNPGTCRPREPWIFSPHARHRVRSPRKGRDAACRVRGPPARYACPRAHDQQPLQATGISDQRGWPGLARL
jgi:hypothetical protein